jgi:hypothetical protein
VWGNLKAKELANLCPDTIAEAAGAVDEGLCRIGSETELYLAFLRHRASSCDHKPGRYYTKFLRGATQQRAPQES